MNIINLLPASPNELAAITGKTLKQIHGILAYYKGKKKAVKTNRVVPNANQSRGRRHSAIWVRAI